MDEIKPILSAENLVHTYGVGTPFEKTAVDGVSVDIFRTETNIFFHRFFKQLMFRILKNHANAET